MSAPVSRKLRGIQQHIANRAAVCDRLSVAELEQVADVLRLLIPYVEAMEDHPVPERMRVPPWQVIDGGRRQPPVVPLRRSEPQGGAPPRGGAPSQGLPPKGAA